MIADFAGFTRDAYGKAAGSKAGTLAQLYQAGLPVPEGFIVLCSAFDAQGVKAEFVQALDERFGDLLRKSVSGKVAVRSSGLNEDSSAASHAGEYSSVLHVADKDALYRAIRDVRASGAKPGSSTMTVLVQEQIDPDYAGVMFTLDPVSDATDAVVGNFTTGLADALLTGDQNALTFRIDKRSGEYVGDAALRALGPVLLDLALRLEKDAGTPVDIEWAVRAGRVFILQRRPITGGALASDTWNDSLRGDYLWTNTNTGEAFNGTLTPLSMSCALDLMRRTFGTLNGAAPGGAIAGRLYLNLSYNLAIYKKLGLGEEQARRTLAQLAGTIPEGITVPELQVGWGKFARFFCRMLKQALSHSMHAKAWTRWLQEECPAWCDAMAVRIESCVNDAQLFALSQEAEAKGGKTFALMAMTMSLMSRQRTQLEDLLVSAQLSASDAGILLSGLGQGAQLESLQPLLGFSALMRGEISRAEFVRRYGHRGALEVELAEPRPAEDPAWLDALAAQWSQSAPEALVSAQQTTRAAIWTRLESRPSKTLGKIKKLYASCSRLFMDREIMRSESTRMVWLLRRMVLKAAALHGLGDELFFLEYQEMKDFLHGDRKALAQVPARKRLYDRYRRLPGFPTLIAGAFRPFEWAASPDRRTDVFDAHRQWTVTHEATLKGFPGSVGIVEGTVRVLEAPTQFNEFIDGEILVTSHTNIGWTLIFPRVRAIVTDIGAPLSHTAIIAREMGIPAVVGTGVATSRLKTGDKVRVDGGKGTVDLLE